MVKGWFKKDPTRPNPKPIGIKILDLRPKESNGSNRLGYKKMLKTNIVT